MAPIRREEPSPDPARACSVAWNATASLGVDLGAGLVTKRFSEWSLGACPGVGSGWWAWLVVVFQRRWLVWRTVRWMTLVVLQ